MSHRKSSLIAVLAAVLAIPAAANAAEATVNATAKTGHLTGSINEPVGAYDLVGFFNGGTEVGGQTTCLSAPVCDSHTLHVGADGAELKLDATSDADNLSLELISPDGTYTEINETDLTAEHHRTLDATAGDWTVRVYGSGTFDYDIGFPFRTPEDVAQDPPPADDTEE